MATETVVSDHSPPSVEVEKEEVKKIEGECASDPPKETVESIKPDESLRKAAPAPPTQEKVEDKPVEVDKKIDDKSVESKELEEVEKVVDVPESLPVEVFEKIEEKVEATEAKDVAVSKAESKPEEITQPAPAAEQAEQSQVKEEVEKETAETELVEAKICTDKTDDAELPKKEETSPSEVEDKAAEPEKIVKDGIEKCETGTSPETTEEVKETAKEVEKTEAAEKIEEAKSEEEKKVSDVPKEDAPVKTQKQSIVKIVKQSLVKAKKAIIGKSNNSKTPAPESKDDGSK